MKKDRPTRILDATTGLVLGTLLGSALLVILGVDSIMAVLAFFGCAALGTVVGYYWLIFK